MKNVRKTIKVFYDSIFRTYLETHREEPNIFKELKLRISKFEQIWDEFNVLQEQIEEIDETTDYSEAREESETQYFKLHLEVHTIKDEMTHQEITRKKNPFITTFVNTKH